MPDDLKQTALGLAEADPLMRITQAVASLGQAVQSGQLPQSVQDAYDTIKSHLESGSKTVQDAAKTLLQHVSDAVVPKLHAEAADDAPIHATPDQIQPIHVSADQLHAIQPADTPAQSPGSGLGTMQNAFEMAKEGAKGFAKGAGRSVQAVADDLPHMFGGAGLSDYIDLATGRPKGTTYQMAQQGLQSRNTAQAVGGGLETATELGLPVSKAIEEFPTAAKAGAKFQQVMAAAKNVPVDTSVAGDNALRVLELSERGGRLPKPVSDFLRYVTNPDKPQMTYEVGRDFAQTLGKLSVNERNAMTPVVQREVAIMTANHAKAVAEAANKAGQGQVYAQAMTEYARAKGIANTVDEFLKGARRALPWMLGGSAAAAGAYGAKKAIDIIGGGE